MTYLVRKIDQELLSWQKEAQIKPFMLFGASRVGKTAAVKRLIEKCFKGPVINVDCSIPEQTNYLLDTNVNRGGALGELVKRNNLRLIPGSSLVFFDNLHCCPQLIKVIVEIFNNLPSMHIVASSVPNPSILQSQLLKNFTTSSLSTLSFSEFLRFRERDFLVETLQSKLVGLVGNQHSLLLEELQGYFLVGGMPEAVEEFKNEKTAASAFNSHQSIREALVKSLRFAAEEVKTANEIYKQIATCVSRPVYFDNIGENFSVAHAKELVDRLEIGGLISRVNPTNFERFGTLNAKVKQFRLLLADLGVLRHMLGLGEIIDLKGDKILQNKQLLDQYIGQELRAVSASEVYYWMSSVTGSDARVDYLCQIEQQLCPLIFSNSDLAYVKRQFTKFKSMNPGSGPGILVTTNPYKFHRDEQIIEVPLYYLSSLVEQGFSF